MTIAYDPKPTTSQTPGIRNVYPNVREITDETTYEDGTDDQPDRLRTSDEDWINMYVGKNMEENY